ncbi:MAG: TolC family protein [Pseudomonadota bacterium]
MTCKLSTKTAVSVIAALSLFLSISACSNLQPRPLSEKSLAAQGTADRAAGRAGVEPITAALTMEQAVARALKYNLDRRAKMMEEALALNQLDVAHYDMLPRLLAQAGYTSRNNDRISLSENADTGLASPSQFISQERIHTASSLGLSWSMLDLGVGYLGTLQQADRVLIAGEKRRKAMHVLMQDVRTAFWRAVSAQKLQSQVRGAVATANEALAESGRAAAQGLRNPVDSLRYQRQLRENMRLLDAINQELSTAQIELATLINEPAGQNILLAEPPLTVNQQPMAVPVEAMEDIAITSNADLREHHYNARIAREETRKTMVKLFPNLVFNYSINYDTDRYLVNSSWREAGLHLSFNLFNLLTGPTQMKLAEAGVKLADQRRVAMQIAVIAQVHLARQQVANSLSQFEQADAIWEIDRGIAEHMKNREASQTISKLDLVANETTAILSLLRRYQALAQAQIAEARLQATLGVEPKISGVSETSLADLERDIGLSRDVWQTLPRSRSDAGAKAAQ